MIGFPGKKSWIHDGNLICSEPSLAIHLDLLCCHMSHLMPQMSYQITKRNKPNGTGSHNHGWHEHMTFSGGHSITNPDNALWWGNIQIYNIYIIYMHIQTLYSIFALLDPPKWVPSNDICWKTQWFLGDWIYWMEAQGSWLLLPLLWLSRSLPVASSPSFHKVC